tara:strand:- start:2479 stop:3183 length:705 start_codon:yes stop_codon:yes gene_type:complete
MKKISQVVLLAGGKGTRMREMTENLPKPMVQIGGKPVLEHLINIFSLFGDFEFIICSGYLGDEISSYFSNRKNIKVIDTGLETPTGGRLYNVSDYLNNDFIVTYGDGLANVNIESLIDFHLQHENIGTITVSNPTSRFGLVKFDDNSVVEDFIEKPKLTKDYVNIGFMVFNKRFINYLNKDSTLETEPLVSLSQEKELRAFIHNGYFEPMDTYREYIELNKLWESGETPWLNYE